MNPILLIPARMASTRLPDKPLADIAGVPMIVRVWARAMAAGLGPVVVAAGEPEIVAGGGKGGGPGGADRSGPALRLRPHLGGAGKARSGRRAMTWWSICRATCRRWTPSRSRRWCAALAKSGADIATLAAPIDNAADETNPAVVKAVVAWDADGALGRALYFTRATAPAGDGTLCHHVGHLCLSPRCAGKLCRPAAVAAGKRARSWNSCARWKRA